MLNLYEDTQPIIVKTLKNAISNNKLSHAYLFDISNYNDGYNLIMSFVKEIIAIEDNRTSNEISSIIDDGNYPDLEIIEPDGQWIKKDQMTKLQSDFSTKSIYNNKKIYIIKGAEFLNGYSANAILKFLEEPADNIIAILVTSNLNNVMDTIKSRCQIFTFNLNKEEEGIKIIYNLVNTSNLNLELPQIKEVVNNVITFVKTYEHRHKYVLTHSYNLWFKYFNDKSSNILALSIMLFFYKDVVNYKIKRNLQIFSEYSEIIGSIANANEINILYKKINLIDKTINKNKINININLNLYNMIIEMEKVYD